MVGHGGSSAGSYLADPTSPIPYHYASIVTTSTVRVNNRNCTSQLPCKVSSVLIAEFVSHYTAIVRVTLKMSGVFFANNSVIIVSATMKLGQNLVHLTP